MILIALTLCMLGCKKAEPIDVVDVMQSAEDPAAAAQSASVPAEQPEEAALSPDEYGGNARVEVTATAAYVFEGTEGLTLYGAVEYKNTGDCPIQLTNASFGFSVAGTSVQHDFVPVLSEYDVVLPGQTSFVTLWLPNSGVSSATSLSAGAGGVALTASLACKRSDLARNEIEVSNIYLADNYPGFTTMNGTLVNAGSASCALNMIYVGFYDGSGALLGAWHFTRNAQLEAGDSKDFVVHMKELPIPGLAGKAAATRATGFGFN